MTTEPTIYVCKEKGCGHRWKSTDDNPVCGDCGHPVAKSATAKPVKDED